MFCKRQLKAATRALCPQKYGSGGLKPTPVRLWLWLFAQNKRSPPHYAVNTKPVSSAAVRALQMIGLLLYFWGQQKIPFWIAECKWGWVSLLKQEGSNPVCTLQSKMGSFAGPKNTEANRSSVERVQLQRTLVLCSRHNGVAISYFEQTEPHPETHGLGSV